MPKSHKDISLFAALPGTQSEPQGFAPDQMVRCEECLRANPPTRSACLYCGATLPDLAASPTQPKPVLRPLEKWEQGYNSILKRTPQSALSEKSLGQAASVLRLAPSDLTRIIGWQIPLPLARAASRDEAELIERSLTELGLETIIVSDETLAIETILPHRLRAVDRLADEIAVHPTTGDAKQIAWNQISLIVTGRLFTRQVEVKEQRRRGPEGHIVDARETTSDEAVLDIYTQQLDGGWRILANNFDFSCLGNEKTLLAGENFALLSKLIRKHARLAQHNDSYNDVRRSLELVWPSAQQTSALGWRRERAGRYSTSELAVTSNESQFTRYSRLSHFLGTGQPEASR